MNISRSVILALSLTAMVIIWMLTGLVGGNAPDLDTAAAPAQAPRNSMQVTVRESTAKPVTREISISARTEPNRSVTVAAETDGRIVAIHAERGSPVTAGQAIASIDIRDRNARATEARAQVEQRELEYQAAERLRGREFISESQIAEARARLESARAALAGVELEIARTSITVPFDGVVEERSVELGDFVGIGDPIITIVDTDPLIVVGDVSEREISDLDIGSRGEARLLNGDIVQGTVRYIAPVASGTTRTFRVELSIPNPDNALRAGMSAQVSMPSGEIYAHNMTPALLTLDDAGNVGVKAVDDRNRVLFYPVDIAESGNNGVWVTGLPDRVTVITIGQGFVAIGETVQPVSSDAQEQANEYSAP